MDFDSTLKAYRERVEDGLRVLVPNATTRPERLHAAMSYSLLAGGKRLRPILILAVQALYPFRHDALPAAVAMECLHTYSLIHDDLPCMDDSDLRRGRPTCHQKFDEATALLAGDSLLTLAFELLSRHYAADPPTAVSLLTELTVAAGSRKLIGGQMEDLLAEEEEPDREHLAYIHANKTGALLTACFKMGVLLTERKDAGTLAQAEKAGQSVGLAFQIIDDILDVTSDSRTLGKTAGADAGQHKMTYPALFGLEESRRRAAEETENALGAIRALDGKGEFLAALVAGMGQRLK